MKRALLLVAATVCILPAAAREYIKRDDAQPRAYSPAVVTEGGKIISRFKVWR